MDSEKNREANISYFNRWSRFYNKDPISLWLLWTQRKVLGHIPIENINSLLDVGCGTGSGLQFLSQKGIKKLAGIDLSPEMIRRARQKLPKSITLKVASVDRLPFPDNSFDMVINTEAFHHFPEPKTAIKEMARVLKKGGLLCISDINFCLRPIHWLFEKLEPGCVRLYSLEEFRTLFREVGLKIIEQKRVRINGFSILTIGQK